MKKTAYEYNRVWCNSISFSEHAEFCIIMNDIGFKVSKRIINLKNLLEVYEKYHDPCNIYSLMLYYHNFFNQPDISKKLYEEFKSLYGELTDEEVEFFNQEPSTISIDQEMDY